MKKIKKPISILLTVLMVFSVFAVVPFTASAADNAIQIGNIDASGEHWSYVASTKTLTLNEYNFSGYNHGIDYTGSGTLSIVLVGHNSIDAKYSLCGIYINISDVGLRISGDGSLDLKSENNCGIYTRGNMEFAGGTINISGDTGIYNHDHHITISGSEIYATGSNCGIYTKNGGMLYITGGKLVATGGSQAIKNDNASAIKNNMTGTGWTNTEGTEGEATIPVSTEGQKLTYKKVQFPTYTITWNNWDDSKLADTTVQENETPTYPNEDPTRPDDDGNTYTFAGWTPAVVAATADATYTATFDATPYVASVTAGGTTTKYTDFVEARNAWTAGTTLTLLSDIEMTTGQHQDTEIWAIVVEDAKTLDLNGKRLSLASSVSYGVERVIAVLGNGNLTIKDSSGTNAGEITGVSPNGGNPGWSAGLYINQNGTATMYGGTITGNTTETGAGVLIDGRRNNGGYRAATFNMYGGVIKGNTATTGGGVYVGNRETKTGYFNMFGGTITGNEATTGKNVYVNGNNAVMTHTGGTINGGFSHNDYVAVTFNANGGDGTMSAQYVKKNTATTIKKNENYDNNGTKTEPAFTRDGYTFAGWNTEPDGSGFNYTAGTSNLYINNDTILYANWKPNLFVGHSISLEGDIALNFFINPKAVGATNFNNYSKATVEFTWDEGNGEQYGTESVDLKNAVPDAKGYVMATCNVAAAHMGHKVLAKLYLDSEEPVETNAYSVREYAEEIFAHPENYVEDGDSEKAEKLQNLVQAMLNYGAMSQVVFNDDLVDKTVDPVNKVVGYNGYENVTAKQIADAINGEASDLNAIATQLKAKYYTTSLLYLSKSKLRVYFTPTTYTGQIPNSEGFTGNKKNYYYYKESNPIAAADLDEQQKLSVNGVDFYVSALDYAKVIVENKNNQMNEEQMNLAKALFLYNQAANEYFVK